MIFFCLFSHFINFRSRKKSALGERADLKINVYHKSSIIDEFVGRVVISLTELYNENYKSFTRWYKLTGKPDKSENTKKPDKERGEIEIRTEFVIRPKGIYSTTKN
jgi:hypothetical protein